MASDDQIGSAGGPDRGVGCAAAVHDFEAASPIKIYANPVAFFYRNTDMSPMSTVDRFAFGKNWQSFAAIADEESISEARRGLIKLFPNGEIREFWMWAVALACPWPPLCDWALAKSMGSTLTPTA